ncbi:MAG: hypothetical protein HGA47_14970 [Zoogloea sp.]|nr:hypothetical protein [Zoogloea sp.]
MPGESRSFTVTYPADHHRKRFAGKTVRYDVFVKEIKEKLLPELGDDFAKDLGAEGLDQLRARVREELVTKARETAEKSAREQLVDEALRRNPFDVPGVIDCGGWM